VLGYVKNICFQDQTSFLANDPTLKPVWTWQYEPAAESHFEDAAPILTIEDCLLYIMYNDRQYHIMVDSLSLWLVIPRLFNDSLSV